MCRTSLTHVCLAASFILLNDAAVGFAQTSANAAALARARADAVRKIVSSAAAPEAIAAVDAAQKAAQAASAAGDAATKATGVATNEAATLEEVKAAAGGAAKAAQEAAAAAKAASSAAAAATTKIDVEPAKSVAGKAAAAAVVAANAAAGASEAAGKANATVTAATAVGPAQKAATTVATETGNGSIQTSEAAVQTSIVAEEAVAPSLPVLGPGDESVLAALRARVTGGAIFFNGSPVIVRDAANGTATLQSNQFSQAATYLAFESQPRLWSNELMPCRDTQADPGGALCKAQRRVAVEERGYYRVFVEPFVNVRLTTIPVANAMALTGPIQAPTQAFLQSQKAAQLQIGGIFAFNFGHMRIKDTDFHWSVGPMFRFMFQSVTDSQRALRLWDLDNDLFKMHSGGARLSLFQKDQRLGDTVREGWAPSAFLDVSYGKFENFETAVGKTESAITCLQNGAACLGRPQGLPSPSEFEKSNNRRWSLEGRLFLQYVYLGFDLNTGKGPDDLRFIAGVTVKLEQFITRRN